MSELTPVYLIFGIPDSQRREVLFDLIDGGRTGQEGILYFRPRSEGLSEFDDRIASLPNVQTVEWELSQGKVKHGTISAAADKLFFLAPGTSDPADVAEALKAWTTHNRCFIARIITVVHSSFLKSVPQAQAWFDACIHFSDVVLLARREAVENQWIKEFQTIYRKACYPCLIELVTKGKTKNPVAILDPTARRLSLYFDELIPLEEDEFDDEDKPDDLRPDRYIERNESGQRAFPVPDIARLLTD